MFRDAHGFVKTRKQFVSGLLSTIVKSLQSAGDIMQMVAGFAQQNNMQSEDIYSLDNSSKVELAFEQPRFRLMQLLTQEEIKRITSSLDGFMTTENFDVTKVKMYQDNYYIEFKLPTRLAQIIRKCAQPVVTVENNKGDLTIKDMQEPELNG